VIKNFSASLFREQVIDHTGRNVIVSLSSWNSSNAMRHAGNTSFRQLSQAYHRAKLQRRREKRNGARSVACIIDTDAMRISHVGDSATRSARTITNDVLPRNEKDGNFNREESRNRSGEFAEDDKTKSRWQDQKYPIAVITRDR